MKITVLGSGSILSPAERNPSGYLLETNAGLVLLEAGTGILQQLKRLPLDPVGLKLILISHYHLDHCADLFPILMYRYVKDKNSHQGLTIIGPQGLNRWYDFQRQWHGSWLESYRPQLLEWKSNEAFSYNGLLLQAKANGHTEISVSITIEEKQRKLFYSSDTGYNEDLKDLAQNADLAILECSLPDEVKVSGHLTPSEVGRWAKFVGLQRIMLTHFYPQNDHPGLKQQVAAHFSGEIIIAKDFLQIEL